VLLDDMKGRLVVRPESSVKVVVPDLISPSYFPMIAAVQLGSVAAHGVEPELELQFPVTDAVSALRRGECDFVAGSAHALFHEASDGGGITLLAALSRNTYWFLVVRTSLGLGPEDDLAALAGLRIGAAPGPDQGLIQVLIDAGVDPELVDIAPVPGAQGAGVSFGVTAVAALEAGAIDGFWANGMGAELAVRSRTGTVVLDARRGDGPAGCAGYTFSALMCMSSTVTERFEVVRGVVRGLIDAQRLLRRDPTTATTAARDIFPSVEAGLIATLVARDAPYYDHVIEEAAITSMMDFVGRRRLSTEVLTRADLVPSRVVEIWGTDR
jgi:ABC-type nitrate/sulfonate/bicarbonate transport system substrate-binding protein